MIVCLAVKIKCMPLQQELYRTYLLIQDIDPNARLSKELTLRDRFNQDVVCRYGKTPW